MAYIITTKSGDILGAYATEDALNADTVTQGDVSNISVSELKEVQVAWRNKELKNSDWIITITDHSNRDAYLTYRQKLRDWPATDTFPYTRPTL